MATITLRKLDGSFLAEVPDQPDQKTAVVRAALIIAREQNTEVVVHDPDVSLPWLVATPPSRVKSPELHVLQGGKAA